MPESLFYITSITKDERSIVSKISLIGTPTGKRQKISKNQNSKQSKRIITTAQRRSVIKRPTDSTTGTTSPELTKSCHLAIWRN